MIHLERIHMRDQPSARGNECDNTRTRNLLTVCQRLVYGHAEIDPVVTRCSARHWFETYQPAFDLEDNRD